MFLKEGILSITFCLLAVCCAWAPAMVSSETTGIYYCHNGKAEEVYRVSIENAYVSTIRTMNDLGLEIIEIKKGEHRRIIIAQEPPAKCQVTVELEGMRDGKYIKASFKAVKHAVLPDFLYVRLIMKEFNNNLKEVQNEPTESKQARTFGGE